MFRKAFTLIELLVVIIIVSTLIAVTLIKTSYEISSFSVKTIENIKNIKNQITAQQKINSLNLKDILYYYDSSNNVFFANDKTLYKENLKEMLLDIANKLGIVYGKDQNLNGIKVDIPLIIFTTYENKLVFLGFNKKVVNGDNEVLNLTLYSLNNKYYFKTLGRYNVDDLLYFYKNNNVNYNDYINDLIYSSNVLIENIMVISNESEKRKTDLYKYVLSDTIKNSIFVIITNNINAFSDKDLSRTTSFPSVYDNFIDDLGKSKRYYFQFKIKYFKHERKYLFFNGNIK